MRLALLLFFVTSNSSCERKTQIFSIIFHYYEKKFRTRINVFLGTSAVPTPTSHS
jgi:hypothetical protein